MTFSELQDKAVKRIAAIEKTAESGTFPGMAVKPDRERRETFQFFSDRGSLQGNLLEAVERAERRFADIIRRGRAVGLSGAQLHKLKERARSEAVSIVETAKAKRVKKLFADLDTRRSEYKRRRSSSDYSNTSRDLLALQRFELAHANIGDGEAAALLQSMRARGYSEDELLVLASKGKKARRMAEQIRAELPPHVADEEGISKLAEIRELVDLPTGVIAYRFRAAPNVTEQLHIGILLDDSEPTASEIDLGEATA